MPSTQSATVPVPDPLQENAILAQPLSVTNGGHLDGSSSGDSVRTVPHVKGLNLKKRQCSKSPDSRVMEANPAKIPKRVGSPDGHVTEARPAKVPLSAIVTQDEQKQAMVRASLLPEEEHTSGTTTSQGSHTVLPDLSAAVADNEVDVLLRLYQLPSLGADPQPLQRECDPVGVSNSSPAMSPLKTSSTGCHSKMEKNRSDSFLATSFLDGTPPFEHNGGEDMTVDCKDDGACKSRPQPCSSTAVGEPQEGVGEGAAARTPRKCSASTKKARKFVFSSSSKETPSRQTAKRCLMVEYADGKPPSPPLPQGDDGGDGSEEQARGT